MSENLMGQLEEQLLNHALPGGGWSYSPGNPFSTEATAWACIALHVDSAHEQVKSAALTRLAACQRADGGVPVYEGLEGPCWPTALSILAWHCCGGAQSAFSDNIARAKSWLLKTKGAQFRGDPQIYGHDTQLAGWPWVNGTHSWIEPTAMAILALRLIGEVSHPRVQEGVDTILDRAIPGGGWNYGNSKMFGSALRPFPASTGAALMALAGLATGPRIEAGLRYLEQALSEVRAPLSLSWGLMSLTAWQRRPVQAESWLEACVRKMQTKPFNCLHQAFVLLASRPECPFPMMESIHASRG